MEKAWATERSESARRGLVKNARNLAVMAAAADTAAALAVSAEAPAAAAIATVGVVEAADEDINRLRLQERISWVGIQFVCRLRATLVICTQIDVSPFPVDGGLHEPKGGFLYRKSEI